MKAKFHRFKAFIEQNIWADFLFVFFVYGLISYFYSDVIRDNDISLGAFMIKTTIFSALITLLNRIFKSAGPHPLELGDHATYFSIGQRAKLKSYLETKGYSVNRNEGATTYFDPPRYSKSHLNTTFIYETEHWMALIASPEIQLDIPSDISSLYPLIDRVT